MSKQEDVIHRMFLDTFNNASGKKCLDHLKKTFVDRAVYKKGMPFDEVAFREGQRDIVLQIIKEVNRDG